MALQTIYCSKAIFEKIVDNLEGAKELNILNTILYEYSDVILDLSEEDFENKINEYPYKAFRNRPANRIETLPEFFGKIQDENLEEFSTDIFLLDKSNDFLNNVRIGKGIFMFNPSELGIINDYYKPLEYVFLKNGNNTFRDWTTLLKAKSLSPINSALIIDNFLIDSNYDRTKKTNIFNILSTLIPRDLTIPFHLTLVVINADNSITESKAKIVVNELEEFINKELRIIAKIGLVTHTDRNKFHKRAILTNHFFMYSDKGFDIFNEDNIVQNNTDGDIRWVFDSVCNMIGDCRKKLHSEYLRRAKETINFNLNHSNSVLFNSGFVKNRLLF